MNGSYWSAGSQLAFRDAGSGLPIVFLHPTPLDQDYWRPLIADMAGIRAIIPDLRGHGCSPLGPGLPTGQFALVPDVQVLTMQQLAADVLALLDHLEIEQIIFAGCSIGGYVMLELWRQAPQRMRGLAFVCSKPQPDGPEALARRAQTIGAARGQGVAPLFDAMTRSLLGATGRERRPEMIPEIRSHMTLSVDALVAVQAGLAVRPDSVPTVATIDVPVLAIAGGEDIAVSPQDVQAFSRAPGGCEYHLLPDAGHLAAYEQPQKVAALLTDWLRQPALRSE